MCKVLMATCKSGVVQFGGLEVEAEILSEGLGESDGALLLDAYGATYIPNTTPDLRATLDGISDALTAIKNAITSIGANMTGPTTAPPPTLSADLASLTAASSALDTLMGDLQ